MEYYNTGTFLTFTRNTGTETVQWCFQVGTLVTKRWREVSFVMMASSNGNIFSVTDPFCNSPHKGQWRGALIFSLICARINGWVNNVKLVIKTPSCPLWRPCNVIVEVVILNTEYFMYFYVMNCSPLPTADPWRYMPIFFNRKMYHSATYRFQEITGHNSSCTVSKRLDTFGKTMANVIGKISFSIVANITCDWRRRTSG